jgi:hypothetical protein
MAQTLAANLFRIWDLNLEFEVRFRDLNPERPYLILNATNGTKGDFGQVFTFTKEDFEEKLRSDISRYRLANAVMASAAFPAAFNYVTLRNFRRDEPSYMHVFDGGNRDNLGLTSIFRTLDGVVREEPVRYKKVLVILVDSFVEPRGVSESDPDPRDAFIDLNFIDTFECLLMNSREALLQELGEYAAKLREHNIEIMRPIVFDFASLADSELKRKVNAIPTLLSISEEDLGFIEAAAAELFKAKQAELSRVKAELGG